MKTKIFLLIVLLSTCMTLYGGVKYTVGAGSLRGTVFDNNTGLRWTQCSMLSGKAIDATNDCSGSASRYTWENAIIACEDLNFAGITAWRLPNIRELQSIVTYFQVHEPMIDQRAFPNTKGSPYWSSTTYNVTSGDNADAADWAWGIDFLYGNILLHAKNLVDGNNDSYVRCVTGP